MISGRCECGSVKFEISGEIQMYSHCHCSKCRRISGSPFASWATVHRSDFRYVSGEEFLQDFAFTERATSYFCSRCGSGILIVDEGEDVEVHIRMGTLDDPVNPPAAFHEFVGSKASWHEITDNLPQFHESSGE